MRTVEDRKERGEEARSWALSGVSGLTTYFVWLLPMSPLCISSQKCHHIMCHHLTVSYREMSDSEAITR